MKKFDLVLLFTFLFFSLSLVAQKANENYKDGKLYLKIINSSNVDLLKTSLKNRSKLVEINEIFLRYGVSDLHKPFDKLDSPIFERTYELSFADPFQVHQLIYDLHQVDIVEFAEQMPIHRPILNPNDPGVPQQWHLTNIQAFAAWDLHQGGSATVAIVDDAVRIDHEDLNANVWVNPGEIPNNGVDDDNNGYIDDINGWDVADDDNNPMPPNGNFAHGTHCAGIACGVTNNNTGIASIGFSNKIIAVKSTSDAGDPQSIEQGYAGVQYAIAAGADVISMSWGGLGGSIVEQNVFNLANAQGITLLAAAGNDNVATQFYPAAYNHVISVASSAENDAKSGFSNYGNWIDITAPGSNILSTVSETASSYAFQSGTSMACPMVAGLAGLMKSFNNNLTPAQIEACIKSSSDNIDAQNGSYIGLLGAGRINALAALQCINPSTVPNVNFSADYRKAICPGSSVQFTDNSFTDPIAWSWSFPGGTPANSTNQNPLITYDVEGTYDVSLTVTNANGNASNTITGMIEVSLATGRNAFFTEDFENSAPGWTLNNPDNGISWNLLECGGDPEGGNTAAFVRHYNYENATGEIDELISPVIDCSPHTGTILNFDHAHRRFSADFADRLRILVSTDGGFTFPDVIFDEAETGVGNFATGALLGAEFIPAIADDWCHSGTIGNCNNIDFSAYDGQNNVVIKFQTTNDYGNNTFIDNICLSSQCQLTAGPPTASFSADVTEGCPDLTVNFTDQSVGNPSITSWNWSFPGGTPANSTAQNPTVVYDTPGMYDVSLTVTNSQGSDTETTTNMITVLLPTSATCSGYCTSSGQSTNDEWIDNFTFKTIANPSGNNEGYGDFTSLTETVTTGETVNFSITQAYAGQTWPEYFKIFIDYNGDGDFADAGELAYDLGGTTTTGINGTITIPASASVGTTLMRVSMKYVDPNDPNDVNNQVPQEACESFPFGEVEDYTLFIEDNSCPIDITETNDYNSGDVADIESDTYIYSNVTINNGANVTYDAKDCIELNPDFEVQSGAVFHGFIDGCGGTAITTEEELEEK